VSGNLVHRDVLRPAGVSFTAGRAPNELDKEFLASTDPWFRPCSFATGPDGNFYVVDMYREFIETPESIPEELKKDMDFYSGTTMGRIYRIVPSGQSDGRKQAARGAQQEADGRRQTAGGRGQLPAGPRLSKSGQPAAGAVKRPHLSTTPTADLVPLLAHRNGWWRLTAQRLILERQDKSVIPALRAMVLETDFPQARLHALYSLEGLSSLDQDLVERALGDSDPGVREHALQLAELFSGNEHEPGLVNKNRPKAQAPNLESKLISMVDDPSPRVRFQLALTLGAFSGDATTKALATLACRHAQEPWFRTAILSSVGQPPNLPAATQAAQLTRLATFLAGQNFFEKFDEGKGKFLEQLAAGLGVRNDGGNTSRFLGLISNLQETQARHTSSSSAVSSNSELWQVAALSGLARGLALAQAQHLRLPAAEAQLSRLLASPSEKVEAAARSVAGHFEMRSLISASLRQALDTGLNESKRKAAIQSLSSGEFREVRPVFEKLLSAQAPPGLQQAALSSLNSIEDPGVANLLISGWKLFSPAARVQALDVLLSHRQRIPAFLQAIEKGEVERSALDLPRRQKLLQNPDPVIAARAGRLFKEEHSDRARVLAEYRSVIALAGDAARGRGVFDKNCAQCHMPQKGRRIGPDLSGVSSQTKEQLLQNVLDPSREIQARFTNYIVTTKDGRILDGLIVSETPGTVTLRSSDADDQTMLRRNIVEIRASSVSLMPEGLEKNMSRQELADLIAFLQGAGLHHHHER
jgi:putative heme-binding domain-containing protein